jgi:acylphosphatase
VGYAANLDDGRVRVIGEGPRAALEALVGEVERGPRLARVTQAQVTWQAPVGEFTGFGIRRGDGAA